MGQQQLLLILLGLVVIGIAIAIGINLFRAHAISSKRDILTNETIDMAAQAISYYKRAREFGGGGKSFLGWQIPSQVQNTINGSYIISQIYSDSVVLVATGTEIVTGNDSIQVRTTVYSDNYQIQIIH
ncbi:MAG: hypothetical protein HXY50_05010 [Ignavibacteriaceae bacterium]|nr:hypothetical protein [Ignavibacteriaceae bacterium]